MKEACRVFVREPAAFSYDGPDMRLIVPGGHSVPVYGRIGETP